MINERSLKTVRGLAVDIEQPLSSSHSYSLHLTRKQGVFRFPNESLNMKLSNDS